MNIKKIIALVLCSLVILSAGMVGVQSVSAASSNAQMRAINANSNYCQYMHKNNKQLKKLEKIDKYLKANLKTKVKDNKLIVEFWLVNRSGMSLPITFDSNYAYDITVLDAKGNKVFSKKGKLNSGLTLTKKNSKSQVYDFLLKPGRTKELTFKDEWDFAKTGVLAGKYQVVVELKPIILCDHIKNKNNLRIRVSKKFNIKGNQAKADNTFNTSLTTKLDNGLLKLDFSLKNVSREQQDVAFGSGQMYDIQVFNSAGKEVYKWSEGRMFTQALIIKSLKAGEVINFTEVWDMKDKDGIKIPNGKYTVKVEIKVLSVNDKASFDAKELVAEEDFEVTEAAKYVVTSLDTRLIDKTLKMDFTVTNIFDQNLIFRFNTSQKYDIIITDSKNNEVYRWSDDRFFLMAINYQLLEKGKPWKFTEYWDLKDKAGKVVPSGRYQIRVEFRGYPEIADKGFNANELTVTSYIDVK